MPRSAKVVRICIGINQLFDRICTVGCRNTCGGQFFVINRNGKSSFIRIGTLGNHIVELKITGAVFGYRYTNETPAVFYHDVYRFRRHLIGSHQKVALIFTVFVIHNDNHFTVTNILNGFLNRMKWRRCHELKNTLKISQQDYFLPGFTSVMDPFWNRAFTPLSISNKTVSSSILFTVPIKPPPVTTLSPFFISSTFFLISFCRWLCGQIMKK